MPPRSKYKTIPEFARFVDIPAFHVFAHIDLDGNGGIDSNENIKATMGKHLNF